MLNNKENTSDKKRRRYMWSIIVAAAIITAISSFTQAGTNRPLRYYTDNGTTAMTYYTTLANNTTVSGWGINTDYPVCEFQVGDNGSGNWLCMNKTNYYTCSGSTCSAVSAGSSDGNNYTYAQTFNRSGNTVTSYTYRYGIASPLISSFDINDSSSVGGGIALGNATGGYPVKFNVSNTSILDNWQVTCNYAAGYALGGISNDSICFLTFTQSAADALYYSISNPSNYQTATQVQRVATNVTMVNLTDVELNQSGSVYTMYFSKNGTVFDSVTWTDATGNGTSVGDGNTTGNGTAGFIPVFLNSANITNSILYQNGSNLSIGTTAGKERIHILGTGNTERIYVQNTGSGTTALKLDSGTTAFISVDYAQSGTGKWGSGMLPNFGHYFIWNALSGNSPGITIQNGTNAVGINMYWPEPGFIFSTNGSAKINGSLSVRDFFYSQTIDLLASNISSINVSKADLAYVYRVEASLNFTNSSTNSALTSIGYLNTSLAEVGKNATSGNATATSALTSIGYLNNTKAGTGSCGTGNTVIQNATSTGIQCLTLPTSSGSPGGAASTLQFKNSTGSFDGNSNVTIDETNGNVVINSQADVTYLRLDNVTAATIPASKDRLIMYGSNKTGQPGTWYASNASAHPFMLRPAIEQSYPMYCYAQASTVLTCLGTTTTLSGTSTGTGTTDDINTFGRLFNLTVPATSQAVVALAAASSQVYRNNGIDFATTVCMPQPSYGSGSTGSIFFTGFSTMTLKNQTAQDTPPNQEAVGFAYSTNASNTNWMFRTQTTTSETETDTGMPFVAKNCYYMAIYGEKGGNSLWYYVRNLNESTEVYGYTTSNLPTGTSAMLWVTAARTLTTAHRTIGIKNYIIYYKP